MSKITRAEAISLISQAISLAGDGGCTPFTEEEYNAMYDLLEEIKKESKPKESSQKDQEMTGKDARDIVILNLSLIAIKILCS